MTTQDNKTNSLFLFIYVLAIKKLASIDLVLSRFSRFGIIDRDRQETKSHLMQISRPSDDLRLVDVGIKHGSFLTLSDQGDYARVHWMDIVFSVLPNLPAHTTFYKTVAKVPHPGNDLSSEHIGQSRHRRSPLQ